MNETKETVDKSNIIKYEQNAFEHYLRDLGTIGSIAVLVLGEGPSKIDLRGVRTVYCKDFAASGVIRDDVLADALIQKNGIIFKTFCEDEEYLEIFTFKQQAHFYERELEPIKRIQRLCGLWNSTLSFNKYACKIDKLVYHCIVKNSSGYHLHEEEAHQIDLRRLYFKDFFKCEIFFSDGRENYKFSETTKTLYRQIKSKEYFGSTHISTPENPIEKLYETDFCGNRLNEKQTIVLPFYICMGNYRYKNVPKHASFNYWNKRGHYRDPKEMCIHFHKDVKDVFPNFFPEAGERFKTILPNGEEIYMQVCEDENDIIEPTPTNALGKWILKEVVNSPKRIKIAHNNVEELGIDSAIFVKKDDNYYLYLGGIGTYESFIYHVVKTQQIEKKSPSLN